MQTGECKLQTADQDKMQTEGKMQTGDFLTESCHHFGHWELTVKRLTWALCRLNLSDIQANKSDMQANQSDIQANQSDIQANQSDICRLTWVIFRLTRVIHWPNSHWGR